MVLVILRLLPGEPCPEVASGKCREECVELWQIRRIQRDKGYVQAMCYRCGKIIIIAPAKP